MDDTTLIDFSGVIVFARVFWLSGNIYLGLAFFALRLFWEGGYCSDLSNCLRDCQNNRKIDQIIKYWLLQDSRLERVIVDQSCGQILSPVNQVTLWVTDLDLIRK